MCQFSGTNLSHHRAVIKLTSPRIVDYIGPVHAGFVTVAPSTPHDVWDGVAWVTDTAAQHAADVAAAEQKKSALRAATDAEIAWRQDAVDAGLVAEEETAALTEWKKYRVLLMRVDTAKPVWPVNPQDI